MVKKNKILFVLLIFSVVGCVSENTLTKEPVVPTNTITIQLPTSTPTPTLIQPTSTPFLTPFPTLSRSQAFEKLYKSEFECNAPCWWGIIPGVSTWTETEQFVKQFTNRIYKPDNIIPRNKITKSIASDTYVWYVINPIPNTDYSPAIYFEVQNNIVSAIRLPSELVWYFFPIHKLFIEYGKPDRILVDASENNVHETKNYARVYVLYEDQNILTRYSFFGSNATNPLNLCLKDPFPEGDMYLWSSNNVLNFNFSSLKPLEQFSELDVESFHQRFIDKSNRCFEISKKAWE